MKFIRKFLVFILSWLLVNIIGLFCLSICLKNIIQHELLGNLVKENVVPTINETLNETVGNQNYDISDIKVLLESEEMNDVLDMIVDEVIANLSSDENAKSDILDKISDSVQFDVVATNPPVRAGKATVFRFYDEAFARMKDGAAIYVVLQRKQGAPSTERKLNELFGNCETLAIKGGYRVMKAVKRGS